MLILKKDAFIKSIFTRQTRGIRKSAASGYYNTRFRASQRTSNNFVEYVTNINPIDGEDKRKTDRNPNNFKYSANIFSENINEFKAFKANFYY